MGGLKMKMSAEIKEMLEHNICSFATATPGGKPNVVPVGLVKPISDEELLVIDVLFKKTRKNLEENPQVALSFVDMKRLEAYQLKGKAKIFRSGELYEKAFEIMAEKGKRRKKVFNEIKTSEISEKIERLKRMHRRLKPKAVVVVSIEEIYSTMPR